MKNSSPKGAFQQIFKLTQHSAIYAISSLLQKLPGLLLLPVYTNTAYLPSRSDFGDYALIFTFIAFMYFVYLYGMDSALMRFFFLGGHNRKTVFSSIFFMLLLSGAITTLIIVVLSSSIAAVLLKGVEYSRFVKIAGLILFFDSLGNLPFIILRAEEKAVKFTVFRTVRFVLEFSLNILFVVVLRKGVIGILYANLTASLINLTIMSPIIFRYLTPRVDLKLVKEMLLFGLPFLPNGIAYVTIETIDRFLVQEFLGKDAVGLYSPNYKFGTVFLVLVIAFRNAWQPFFLKIASQENARHIYSRVLSYFIVAGGWITIVGTYFIKDVLTIHYFNKIYILGTAYWEGIPLIPIIILSYFFFGIYVVLTPGFYIKKKSAYMIIFTGSGAVINIVANIILLPRLNIWGAALATLLSYFTMMVTIYVVSNKIYPLKIDWNRITKMFILIAATMILFYTMEMSVLVRLLIVAGATACSGALLFSFAERQAITNRFRHYLNRGNKGN